MSSPQEPMYEITLKCGDTVSSAVQPRIGAYRKCIHCDSTKPVVKITTRPMTGLEGAVAKFYATQAEADVTYGYAAGYGYLSASVDHAIQQLAQMVVTAQSEPAAYLKDDLREAYDRLVQAQITARKMAHPDE